MNNKWGKQCDRVCSNICEDDKRVDCCYAAQTGFSYKSIKIQPKFSFDKNTENTVPKITLEENHSHGIYLIVTVK